MIPSGEKEEAVRLLAFAISCLLSESEEGQARPASEVASFVVRSPSRLQFQRCEGFGLGRFGSGGFAPVSSGLECSAFARPRLALASARLARCHCVYYIESSGNP